MAPPRRVVLEKLRVQLELKLQSKLMDGLKEQGFFVTKTSDRFKAGRPDLRVSHRHFGQIDLELKYLDFTPEGEFETGVKKLQQIKMDEMNKAGMPACGLIYVEPLEMFFVTAFLRDVLPPPHRCAKKLPGSKVVDGPEIFNKAMGYLINDLGYRHDIVRAWQQVR